MMKLEEMKGLSETELKKRIAEWKQELFKRSVEAGLKKKVEKPHMFPLLRRTIARAYTVIQQKSQG